MGHVFTNRELLKRALTHSSADARASNERLEFLGDRVLGLIAAEKLHALYPEDAEGALALKFNALVRQETCARAAEAAGLADQLILGEMRDAKTILQEWAQSRKGDTTAPLYTLMSRSGPDHAPHFVVEVSLSGQAAQPGEGGSKREAEQDAARRMLIVLGVAQ